MGIEDEPKELEVLTVTGTKYGGDYLLDDLLDRGYTANNSQLVRDLLERRSRLHGVGERITTTGNTLRLTPVNEGEVVDDKKEG